MQKAYDSLLALDHRGSGFETEPSVEAARTDRNAERSAQAVTDAVRSPGEVPGDGSLVTGDGAGPTFDAILVPEDEPPLDPLVAEGRADERAEGVGTARTDLWLDRNVRSLRCVGVVSQGPEPSLDLYIFGGPLRARFCWRFRHFAHAPLPNRFASRNRPIARTPWALNTERAAFAIGSLGAPVSVIIR